MNPGIIGANSSNAPNKKKVTIPTFRKNSPPGI
jgi:hypothetical protein